MNEIHNNQKVATVSYLAKVLAPIVMLIKAVQTKVMAILSLPEGGKAGQILVKNTDGDGDVVWSDGPTQIEENLKTYIDEQMQNIEAGDMDGGVIE